MQCAFHVLLGGKCIKFGLKCADFPWACKLHTHKKQARAHIVELSRLFDIGGLGQKKSRYSVDYARPVRAVEVQNVSIHSLNCRIRSKNVHAQHFEPNKGDNFAPTDVVLIWILRLFSLNALALQSFTVNDSKSDLKRNLVAQVYNVTE